jgi:cytochrome c-type biogenesis protein CcmH/NrfF
MDGSIGNRRGGLNSAGARARNLWLPPLFLVLTLGTVPALAQGCAMCYSSAKSASKDGQRALSKAVIVLLVPPVGLMAFGVGFAFRYGKRRDDQQKGELSRESSSEDAR